MFDIVLWYCPNSRRIHRKHYTRHDSVLTKMMFFVAEAVLWTAEDPLGRGAPKPVSVRGRESQLRQVVMVYLRTIDKWRIRGYCYIKGTRSVIISPKESNEMEIVNSESVWNRTVQKKHPCVLPHPRSWALRPWLRSHVGRCSFIALVSRLRCVNVRPGQLGSFKLYEK